MRCVVPSCQATPATHSCRGALLGCACRPRLVSLRENLVKAVFNRLLGSQGTTAIGASALSPSELLVALHGASWASASTLLCGAWMPP